MTAVYQCADCKIVHGDLHHACKDLKNSTGYHQTRKTVIVRKRVISDDNFKSQKPSQSCAYLPLSKIKDSVAFFLHPVVIKLFSLKVEDYLAVVPNNADDGIEDKITIGKLLPCNGLKLFEIGVLKSNKILSSDLLRLYTVRFQKFRSISCECVPLNGNSEITGGPRFKSLVEQKIFSEPHILRSLTNESKVCSTAFKTTVNLFEEEVPCDVTITCNYCPKLSLHDDSSNNKITQDTNGKIDISSTTIHIQSISSYLLSPTYCVKLNEGNCRVIICQKPNLSYTGTGYYVTLFPEFKRSFDDLAGFIAERRAVAIPITASKFETLKNDCPCSILITGDQGVGKTTFSWATAELFLREHMSASVSTVDRNVCYVSSLSLWNACDCSGAKLCVELAKIWQRLFESDESHVLVFENVHETCSKKTGSTFANELFGFIAALQRKNASLSSVSERKLIIVTAIDSCAEGGTFLEDTQLRRPDAFDAVVALALPDADARCSILTGLNRAASPAEGVPEDCIREAAANLCRSFSPLDLICMWRRFRTRLTAAAFTGMEDERNSDDNGVYFPVNDAGRRAALLMDIAASTVPTIRQRIFVEIPKVKWNEVGGYERCKRTLRRFVREALLDGDGEAFRRAVGVAPPKGCLLYGPPGCAKTLLARAVATECRVSFVGVAGPELVDKYLGESERRLRDVFRRARAAAPCVIFFDEVDAVAGHRSGDSGGGGDAGGGASNAAAADRFVAQLLTELDGVRELRRVAVLCATNRPSAVDTALLRPGRLDHLIAVPLPDVIARRAILRLRLCAPAVPSSDSVDIVTDEIGQLMCEGGQNSSRSRMLDEAVRITDGYSGAEIVALCRTSLAKLWRRNKSEKRKCGVGGDDESDSRDAELLDALKKAARRCPPRTSQTLLASIDQFERQYGAMFDDDDSLSGSSDD